MSDLPTALLDAPVGARIWFLGEKLPYRIRARSKRYLVCTKPFNLLHTTLYTIVDLSQGIRGTENLIFGMGAESDQDCQEMIERLTRTPQSLDDSEPTEVSRRNRVELSVTRVS
jgi:hypothetical protein